MKNFTYLFIILLVVGVVVACIVIFLENKYDIFKHEKEENRYLLTNGGWFYGYNYPCNGPGVRIGCPDGEIKDGRTFWGGGIWC